MAKRSAKPQANGNGHGNGHSNGNGHGNGQQHATKPLVAMVLQGGGALGAYHIGCFEAMAEAGYQPDWVSGISIGAFNAAVIAGNPPEQRLAKLEELWHDISRPDEWGTLLRGPLLKMFNIGSAFEAMLMGQPHFFSPRLPPPQLGVPGTSGALSYADNSPMRETLFRLADFDLMNSGAVRISLGATKVTNGELVFFDSKHRRIAPEHVMASGALPPGFPPMRIDGELYWDGGCVSNTPLEAFLHEDIDRPLLVFMIDLWDAEGPEPRTIDDVMWRQLQIQYASRTSQHIRSVATALNARHAVGRLVERFNGEVKTDEAVSDAASLAFGQKMDIVHVSYHPAADQTPMSDREFSRPSIGARRQAGYADMKQALTAAPWTGKARPERVGAVVHHVKGGEISSLVHQGLA